jgi:hypothetical protein
MKNLSVALVVCMLLVAGLGHASSAQEPALRGVLSARLNAFAQALQAGDVATVQALLSEEMLNRIATRGPASTFEENLNAFVLREQAKLARVVGNPGTLKQGIVVGAITSEGSGVVAASVLLEGRGVPKPFYFVHESGEYKLNILRPAGDVGVMQGGTTTYDLLNYTAKNQYPQCQTSAGVWTSYGIGPNGNRSVSCWNSCPTWFDGTDFKVGPNAPISCDYNTWGWDLFIDEINGVAWGRCGSPC